MRCYICGKVIKIKRTFRTLFYLKPVFKCSSCSKRYKVFPFRQIIPKQNGLFYLDSLFIEENDFNWLAYNDEVAKWFKTTIKNCKKDDFIFWLDKIDLRTLKLLDGLGNDIYILTKEILVI